MPLWESQCIESFGRRGSPRHRQLCRGLANAGARAGTLYWDPTGTLSTTGGSSGSWDTTTTDWYNSSSGTDVVWAASSTASFAGSGGTVTINGSSPTVAGMVFNAGGYTINGTYTLNNTGAGGTNTGNYVMNASATINSPLAGNLYVTGTGTLSFGGGLTTTNRIVVSGTANSGAA